MPCYHPITAWQLATGQVVFAERGDVQRTLSISCGWCVGCRAMRAQAWAIRATHEAKLWARNCFITLTYADEHLPPAGALRYSDFQRFMRSLRQVTKRQGRTKPIRFLMCGEYGEELGRPHFHALLFNYDFPDKRRWKVTAQGHHLYRSALLERCWPWGHATTGACTFESAGYVARYSMKKVYGDRAKAHYRKLNVETGELVDVPPEFLRCSLKPGIGRLWIQKFMTDVYPDGTVVRPGGVKMKPPKFYDRIFEEVAGTDAMAELAMRRSDQMHELTHDYTDDRLAVREAVAKARLSTLKRG